jgi:Pyruvate/2-oxoacid:ferredoxin oxidoreductase delta subunit
MMDGDGRRRIELARPIDVAKRLTPTGAKKLSDYPHVAKAHLDVAAVYSSPLLMGPPICDELIAVVQHLYTEEEARLVRHLGIVTWRTARQLARAEGLSVDEIEPTMHRLAMERRTLAATGPADRRRYKLLPLIPGVFEMVLISETEVLLSPWHRRFAELFEALYETGYLVQYSKQPAPPLVRYLPVGRTIAAHPMALPSDRLEVVLDQFDVFGVGECQCRTSAAVVGKACDAPRLNCTVMGQWAERGIADGWLKRVSKQNVLALKQEAEMHGLVTWMMNIASTKGQCSCSCCGCCCKALRTVTEFNAPNIFAPPHFLPRFTEERCNHCGRCAAKCPMKAISVDTPAKTLAHRLERCIGCGVCVLACARQKAITMEPVPDYRLPYKSWFSYLFRAAPGMLRTNWNVWRER